MHTLILATLAAVLLASPAAATILTRVAGNAIYPAASNCAAGTVTHDGTVLPVAECAIGEAVHFTVPFPRDGANSWKYLVHWQSASATTDVTCWRVQAAAYPDTTDMTAAVTENAVTAPDSTGDANQAADTRQVTAYSAAAVVRNADGDIDCTGSPSACEGAEVRLIVTRIACDANDLAGDAKLRIVVADTNP